MEFPGTLGAFTAWVQAQSLVGELGSHKPSSTAEKKKKTIARRINYSRYADTSGKAWCSCLLWLVLSSMNVQDNIRQFQCWTITEKQDEVSSLHFSHNKAVISVMCTPGLTNLVYFQRTETASPPGHVMRMRVKTDSDLPVTTVPPLRC